MLPTQPSLTKHGFTLVEILVSLTIIGLFVGLALPAFLRFDDRQKIREAKNELEAVFDFAVSQAVNGQLGNCDVLEGYDIWAHSATEIKISEVCRDPAAHDRNTENVYFTLPHEVEIDSVGVNNHSDFDFRIDSVTGRVTNNQACSIPCTVVLTKDSATYTFEIFATGSIGEGELGP